MVAREGKLMHYYAIDPGTEKSAWIHMNRRVPLSFGIWPNEKLLAQLHVIHMPLVIEMIASYGRPVGETTFMTCLWIGRFIEAVGAEHRLIYRQEVKQAVCHHGGAKDAHIRQALIDRYGPGKEVAVGTKAKPGPLYGFSKDLWAALGIAVTFMDKQEGVV